MRSPSVTRPATMRLAIPRPISRNGGLPARCISREDRALGHATTEGATGVTVARGDLGGDARQVPGPRGWTSPTTFPTRDLRPRARARHEVMPVLADLNPEAERGIAETSRSAAGRGGCPRLGGGRGARQGRLVRAVSLCHAPGRATRPGPPNGAAARRGGRRTGAPAQPSGCGSGAGPGLAEGGRRRRPRAGCGRWWSTAYPVHGRGPEADPPEPVPLPVPVLPASGGWEIDARLGEPGEVMLSAETLGPVVTVRAWRGGHCMRSSASAAPRASRTCSPTARCRGNFRRSLPVLEVKGEINAGGGRRRASASVRDERGGRAAAGVSARRAST